MNLILYPGCEAILRDTSIFSKGGYDYLNGILSMTGHPLYNASAPDVQPPIQHNDVTFADFFQDMVHYANMLVLGGVYINERYFIWLLINHSDRRTVGHWLKSWLVSRVAMFPYNKPLPTPYTVACLYSTITT